jgi:cytidyltransferase-like protein
MSKKKGMIVSGYFNPIDKGHIEYFNNAKAMADELFVIVNNDHQRALKGSKEFQQEQERVFIVFPRPQKIFYNQSLWENTHSHSNETYRSLKGKYVFRICW